MSLWRERSSAPSQAPGMQVGAFGKIPSAGDFLHLRAGSEPATSFESWVEQAMAWAQARRGPAWEKAYQQGAIHAFLYRTPRANRSSSILAGIIKPSSDAVGRRFPLVVFASLPESALLAAPYVLPLTLGDFLQAATEVLVQPANLGSPAALLEQVERIEVPRLDTVEQYAREYEQWTQSTYLTTAWTAIYGAAQSQSPMHALHVISEAVAPFRGQELPTTPLSVRLPLGVGGGAAAVFWMDVVRRLARWQSTIPCAFWWSTQAAGALLLQLGDPPASSLAELWMPDSNSEHVCDLDGPEPSVDRARLLGGLPPPIALCLERPDTRVADLLAALQSS